MGTFINTDAGEIARLRESWDKGSRECLGQIFDRHRIRLRRMVRLRLDRRVQGRIDPSDVLQEAFLEATQRVGQYLENPRMPLFLWLRFLTAQKLAQLHRRHLGAQIRDAGREISLYQGTFPEATSAALAAQLVNQRTSPSQAAIRVEMKIRLQEALNAMDPTDREVLALRHFESLNNAEVAQILGLQENTASQRYVRALQRLKRVFDSLDSTERGNKP